ncbi:MAG: phosphatase PAP2 family protein [Lewinellaceae bacterium]|nr:phosphatase PAP2 family protein [Lewinellaceae bacterium]
MSLRSAPPTFRQLVQENLWFWGAMLLFLMVGGVLLATQPFGGLLFYFSDNRTPWANAFFRGATRMGELAGYLLAAALLLITRFRSLLMVPVVAIVATLLAGAGKQIFRHPRPLRYLQDHGIADLVQAVPGVEMHGGMTSFPSGHTTAAFAIFAFTAFCLPNKRLTGLSLFLLALAVGISRIYLAQHFLQDVYLGAMLGTAVGAAIYLLHWRIKGPSWLDQRLRVWK